MSEPMMTPEERAKFDESMELAAPQLAFPVPERDDEERER
jgi:hypothetical protein